MKIKFGPAGLGPVKTAEQVLENYKKRGFGACEIAFTYGIYIKKEEDALRIGKKASELGIDLSIHAPYWVNLNSAEKAKRESTKKRILACCEIGELMDVKKVVFHPGFYGKKKEEAYKNIRDGVLDMMKEVKKNKWKIKLAPETMGKVNVFGSAEEVAKLVKDIGCSFCLDFSHIIARNQGKIDFGKIKKLFPQKKWHVHFSGIEYGKLGEKRHISTKQKYWRFLFKNLPKNKDITIINESPTMIDDCVEGLKIYRKFV